MSNPLLTVSELKTWLGLTGSQDDTLLGTCADDAAAQAERDTGRVFAAASNVTRHYSTDGQASLVIHDRPYTDASRVVTLSGVTMTEGTDVWFLPDRRNPEVTTTIQLRYYDPAAFRSDPMWWDRNLDWQYARGAEPNDLVISGIIGHPFPVDDIIHAVTELAAWYYYRAKSGASGVVTTPTGEPIELGDIPPRYAAFVRNWAIRTAVASV
jgi:hypothetical protein